MRVDEHVYDGGEEVEDCVKHYDARLRMREATQSLYDIGDEVAEYIENLSQAIADVDVELVDECVLELSEVVDEAVDDAIPLIGELGGLRQAFISGIRGGQLSAPLKRDAVPQPPPIDVPALSVIPAPLTHPTEVPTVVQALIARSDAVAANLVALADWVSTENIRGVEVLGSVKLPSLYSRAGRRSMEAAAAWRVTVPETHPAVARTLRGRRPPEFLGERARVNAAVTRVVSTRGGI